MKQIDLREGARRQHRVVALYAAVQCWERGLEGVAIQRGDLERLLGLKRFKGTRVEWLEEDLRGFFPHVLVFRASKAPDSLRSIFASRRSLATLPMGTMTTDRRVAEANERGLQLAKLALWSADGSHGPALRGVANADEGVLLAWLGLLAQGLVTPQSGTGRPQ